MSEPIANTQTRTSSQMVALLAGERLSVLSAFNAKGDGKAATDGTISSGDATLTSATASFASTDVGKVINIHGAGAVGSGDWLRTTIASVTSATAVELSASAAASVSGAYYEYGTDDGPEIRNALETERDIYLPKPFRGDFYLINSIGPETTDYKVGNERYCFALFSNQKLTADKGAELRLGGGVVDLSATGVGFFYAYNRTMVEVENVELEMNGNRNTNPGFCHGFLFADGEDILVKGAVIRNCPGRNSIVFGGAGGHASPLDCGKRRRAVDCISINGGTSLPANTAQNDFSAFYCDGMGDSFERCKVLHDNYPFTWCGGYELHNSFAKLIGCYAEKTRPAVYIGSEFEGYESTDVLIQGCNFHNVLIGISFSGFSDNADFRRVKIDGNIISTIPFPSPLNGLGQTAIIQPRDDTGAFTYTLKLISCEITNNKFYDLSESNADPSGGAVNLSAIDGLLLSGNYYSHHSGPPIVIRGCPSGTKNVIIQNELLHNFGNSASSFRVGIYLDWTGPVSPPFGLLPYDADNITIRNIVASIPTALGSDNHYCLYFDWDDESTITNLTAAEITLNAVPGMKAGPRASAVTVYGFLHRPTECDISFSERPIRTTDYLMCGTDVGTARVKFFPDTGHQGALIYASSGFSSAYNGLVLGNNLKLDETQAYDTIPSHAIDVGGKDSPGRPGTDDSITFLRLEAGDDPTTDWQLQWRIKHAFYDGAFWTEERLYDGYSVQARSTDVDGQIVGRSVYEGPEGVGAEIRALQGVGADQVYFSFRTVGTGQLISSEKLRIDTEGQVLIQNSSGDSGAKSQLLVRLAPGQSDNPFEIQDEEDNVLMSVDTDGNISGAFGSFQLNQDYGLTSTDPTALNLAGGGISPNSSSIAWGDGSGWALNFGTRASGSFSPRFTFFDDARFKIINGSMMMFRSTDSDGQTIGQVVFEGADNTSAEVRAVQYVGAGDIGLSFRAVADGEGMNSEKMRVAPNGEVIVQDGAGAASRMIIRMVSGQSSNPFEIQDNTEAVLMSVDSDGKLFGAISSLSLDSDYGLTNSNPTLLNLAAGTGSGSDAGSIAWGDGSGWALNLGTRVTGAFAPRFQFFDDARMKILNGSLMLHRSTNVDGQTVGQVLFEGNVGVSAEVRAIQGTGSDDIYMSLRTVAAGQGSNSEKVRITQDGYVIINDGSGAGRSGLAIKMLAGQVDNPFILQDSAGASVLYMTPAGNLIGQSRSALKMLAGQTDDPIEIKDPDDEVIFKVNTLGNITGQSQVVIKMATAQVDNPFEIRDSADTLLLGVDASGNILGSFASSLELDQDYGLTNTNPTVLCIGAGTGSSPNSGSVAWGDGSGWAFNLGTREAGAFVPKFQFYDAGLLKLTAGTIQFNAMTASRVLFLDASKQIVADKLNLNSADYVDVSGFTANKIVTTDGSRFKSFATTGSGFVRLNDGFLETGGGKVNLASSSHVEATGVSSSSFLQWNGSSVTGYLIDDFMAYIRSYGSFEFFSQVDGLYDWSVMMSGHVTDLLDDVDDLQASDFQSQIDTLSSALSALTSVVAGKSDAGHTHDYASSSHGHDYAATGHVHSDYATTSHTH